MSSVIFNIFKLFLIYLSMKGGGTELTLFNHNKNPVRKVAISVQRAINFPLAINSKALVFTY